MAELLKSKRVKFNSGQQRVFIEKCLKKLGINNNALAKILRINIRTLMDWKREKFLMPLEAVQFLIKRVDMPMPKKTTILNSYWHISRAAQKGGRAVYKKYGHIGGDGKKRKQNWLAWWQKTGRFSHPMIKRKSIIIPQKTVKLAEFVGIMLGDGGISKHQITITLNSKDDAQYSMFVIKLLRNLFGVEPGIINKKNAQALSIFISRTNLVDFCKNIGLKVGNKLNQKLDIPTWIQKDKKFLTACLRGLIDTDGCLVIHKYKVNSKEYSYKKLNFFSASPDLTYSVIHALKSIGFSPRLSYNNRNVWLDSQETVKRYFQIVKTSNPKHKERYER